MSEFLLLYTIVVSCIAFPTASIATIVVMWLTGKADRDGVTNVLIFLGPISLVCIIILIIILPTYIQLW